MNKAVLVITALLSFNDPASTQEEAKLPPEVLEKFEREVERQLQEMQAEQHRNKIAADLKWRADWIPDKLTESPADYYFQAYLRARSAEALEGEQKQKYTADAIAALENLQKKAPEWKPDLVEKRLINLRASQKQTNK